MNPQDVKHDFVHGITGVLFGAFGTIASLLPDIEQWLRILLLVLSVTAATISCIKLVIGRKSNKRPNKVSLPVWVMIIAILICGALSGGCSHSEGISIERTAEPVMIAGSSTVLGSDGRFYRLVKIGRDAAIGFVSEVDLWQPTGSLGFGLPVYFRRLQSASDTFASGIVTLPGRILMRAVPAAADYTQQTIDALKRRAPSMKS